MPRPATGKTPVHNFRAAKELWDEASAIADELGETMTDVLVRALVAYIRRHRGPRRARELMNPNPGPAAKRFRDAGH